MAIDYINLIRDKLTDEYFLVDYMKNTPLFIQYFLLKSVFYVDTIIIAKPFTKYGWMLALNTLLSTWRNSSLIVYFNEIEPRYTSSIIIQELVGKALVNEYGEVMSSNKILYRTLSQLASFNSGFREIYRRDIYNYVEKLSRDRIIVSERFLNFIKYDLTNVIIPRLIAYRLVEYDYKNVVEESISNYLNIFKMWLNTKPTGKWIRALSNAFKIINVNPIDLGLPDTGSIIEKTSYRDRYVFIHLNEVDGKYIEMIKILRKAAENRDRVEEILSEWWSEIKDLGEIMLLKKGLIIPDIFSVD
ncbi:MAG: hypothetical protein QXJ42_04220 [Desulfurococcaceae archaeon]